MSVTAGVSDTIIALREKLRGKIGQTKVKRYWPGKAPAWAEEDEEDDRIHKVVVLVSKDDPRLRRLAKTRTVNREEVRADHRRIRHAEIISTDQEEEELRNQESRDEEEDEEIRRRRIKEKNLKRAQEEDLEEELEDEDEYETDDSEEELPVITMIKPFYVQKTERDTIEERERLEAEEQAFKESAKRKLEIRKLETKKMVVEEVRKHEEIRNNMILDEASIEDVETDDEEINESEEYEVWRTREITRIKKEMQGKCMWAHYDLQTHCNGSKEYPQTPCKTAVKEAWKSSIAPYIAGANLMRSILSLEVYGSVVEKLKGESLENFKDSYG